MISFVYAFCKAYTRKVLVVKGIGVKLRIWIRSQRSEVTPVEHPEGTRFNGARTEV
jgi:hypothetical protein